MRRSLSCLVLILITALAFAADLPTVGTAFQVQSTVMQESQAIYVHLPDNDAQQSTAHPVLSTTDAESTFAPVVAPPEALARQGRLPAMIADHLNNSDRARDLTAGRRLAPCRLQQRGAVSDQRRGPSLGDRDPGITVDTVPLVIEHFRGFVNVCGSRSGTGGSGLAALPAFGPGESS